MNTGLFIAASVALLSLSLLCGPRFPRSWLGLFLGGAALCLLAAAGTLTTGAEWTWRSGFEVGGEPVRLRLDALSAWFLVPLAVVGAAGAAYSREYWPDAEQLGSAGRGRAGWSALALSMTLVLLAADGLHFLIFWEAFALAGWVLITLQREHLETRAAGWLYLGASHAGTLGLFAFFALLSARTGGWDWGPMRHRPELAPLFWLALFGFGVKAGLFPLHIWLPSAHATAPSHVSALFSGMGIKLGLYGILRTTQWLPLPAGAGWVLLGLGAVSVVFGAASALGQADLKRLLAYCSVENIGVILVGWGAALLALDSPGAAWGGLAAAGALLHVWNHAFFKSLLFLGAGSVLHATGTREMSRLGGLWKTMPWTTCLFTFGAVAISALPPLNGLVSEFLIYLGLLEASAEHGRAALGALPATIALAVGGALALAAFVKAGGIVFLGACRTRAAAQAHESGWWMRAPMVGLGAACLLLALAPATAWPALDSVVRSWNPAWGASTAPASLVTLGHFQRVLALLLLAGAIAMILRSKFNGLRRAATWDCGYAAPTARIQYTALSFSSIALGWFGRVLRPQTRLRRPRGVFPNKADHSETLPDAVLEHAFRPLAAAVMSASGWVRQRQHGHLPEYILYLVAALVAVTAVIVLGELAMIATLEFLARLTVWLALAPLLPGIINKVKAWVAGRQGPPVLQLYYDLARLWRKGVVLSTLASPGFVAGPAIAWVAVLAAALLLPIGPLGTSLSFRGDVILLIYLLALARFATAWAALETGSAFEGMGAAREVSFAVLSEAAVITAVLTLSLQSGSVSLNEMLAPSAGTGALLLAAGLFTVLLAENCRVPFDDPNTHLELAMIHEVMVLDHSGPPLAVILHGASMKLLLFSLLLVQAVLPLGRLSPFSAVTALIGGVLGVTVGVGLVESLMARCAFKRVPLLLTTAFLLCVFALMVAWRGGAS